MANTKANPNFGVVFFLLLWVGGNGQVAFRSPRRTPYNLSVTTSHFSATATWIPAYFPGVSLLYELWFKRLGRDEMDWEKVRIHPDNATSTVIHDLLPDAEYKFSIHAKTKPGAPFYGMFSEVFRKRTKSLDDTSDLHFGGEAMRSNTSELVLLSRPNPPTDVTIHPFNHPSIRNGLNISWSDRSPYSSSSSFSTFNSSSSFSNMSSSAGPASFYIVEYRSKDSIGWEENKPVLWSALTGRLVDRMWTIFHDVRPGFRYDFRVFAFSAPNSFSIPSEVVSHVAPTEPPPSSSIVVSTAAIAGIAGGLAFVLVAATLTAAAIHYVKRRANGAHAKPDKYRLMT